MRDFLIIWSPRDFGATVNQMRVIDALGATDMSAAKRHMLDALKRGDYAKHGDGHIELVEASARRRFFSAGPVKAPEAPKPPQGEVTERGLTVEIDGATQYATVYRNGAPVATFQRRRTYEAGPEWKCFDLHGGFLFSHMLTNPVAMLRRLSRRLDAIAERNEAIRAECELPAPHGV